jgi:uncharacterized membrane protein
MAIKYSEEHFSGPWPHPETLRAYQEIDPALVDKIVERASVEQQFRHEMIRRESDRVDRWFMNEAHIERRGQWFAGGIACVTVVGATIIALYAHPWAGVTMAGGTLATIVGAFIAGRRQRGRRAAAAKGSEAASEAEADKG